MFDSKIHGIAIMKMFANEEHTKYAAWGPFNRYYIDKRENTFYISNLWGDVIDDARSLDDACEIINAYEREREYAKW